MVFAWVEQRFSHSCFLAKSGFFKKHIIASLHTEDPTEQDSPAMHHCSPTYKQPKDLRIFAILKMNQLLKLNYSAALFN